MLLLDDGALVRAVAAGRRRNEQPPFRRIELRYVDVKAGRRLQITSYDETQAHTRNVEVGEPAENAIDEVLAAPYANWHLDTASTAMQVRMTKKGRALTHTSRRSAAAVEPARSHDRLKRRRLDATDPLFAALGVTTSDGKVKPTRTAKFRQVQDFLAALDPVVDDAVALGPGHDLSDERPLRLVDLGCGNAHLTFAAARFLTSQRGLPVHGVGVDVKAQARHHNDEIAAELDMADSMTFIEGTIGGAELDEAPDLVLALHACDTATDDALARAVQWHTPVIVAAPCCHHDIQRQLKNSEPPEAYRLVTRHGILRERMADVLTDALRAAILRLLGYRVEVMEFVDSRHTPRNAMIRAVYTGAPAMPELVSAYRTLTEQWSVQPALADLLEQQLSAVLDAQ